MKVDRLPRVGLDSQAKGDKMSKKSPGNERAKVKDDKPDGKILSYLNNRHPTNHHDKRNDHNNNQIIG